MKEILLKTIEVDGVKLSKKNKISIIIRTKNEEKWIARCLRSINSQIVSAEIEKIIVDNNSSDGTLEVAKRFDVSQILNIDEFMPGKAINDGVRASSGNYIVCISAHCVPKDDHWLQTMLNNFFEHKNIAGVYGRQLPLSYTNPVDKRDLLIVFGLDKRFQKKDYFFHNANSMIPRKIWDQFPFDENVSNIEDRVWGKKVIQSGLNIIYEPDASVYHHHGLHQGNDLKRASGVVSILKTVDREALLDFPRSMQSDCLNIVAVIPVLSNSNDYLKEKSLFRSLVKTLKDSNLIKKIYCLSDYNFFHNNDSNDDLIWIDRINIQNQEKLSLNKLLKSALDEIENKKDFPDSILYVNHRYTDRPKNLFDQLILDAQVKGCDSIFPGLIDYGHYWYKNGQNDYSQTDSSLKSRDLRDPLFKALYGLGCLSSSWLIRSGKMIGGKVGIFKLDDSKYSNRAKR